MQSYWKLHTNYNRDEKEIINAVIIVISMWKVGVSGKGASAQKAKCSLNGVVMRSFESMLSMTHNKVVKLKEILLIVKVTILEELM